MSKAYPPICEGCPHLIYSITWDSMGCDLEMCPKTNNGQTIKPERVLLT
jgi:hypothetical protein